MLFDQPFLDTTASLPGELFSSKSSSILESLKKKGGMAVPHAFQQSITVVVNLGETIAWGFCLFDLCNNQLWVEHVVVICPVHLYSRFFSEEFNKSYSFKTRYSSE